MSLSTHDVPLKLKYFVDARLSSAKAIAVLSIVLSEAVNSVMIAVGAIPSNTNLVKNAADPNSGIRRQVLDYKNW